jgi:hypothetical protein
VHNLLLSQALLPFVPRQIALTMPMSVCHYPRIGRQSQKKMLLESSCQLLFIGRNAECHIFCCKITTSSPPPLGLLENQMDSSVFQRSGVRDLNRPDVDAARQNFSPEPRLSLCWSMLIQRRQTNPEYEPVRSRPGWESYSLRLKWMVCR